MYIQHVLHVPGYVLHTEEHIMQLRSTAGHAVHRLDAILGSDLSMDGFVVNDFIKS